MNFLSTLVLFVGALLMFVAAMIMWDSTGDPTELPLLFAGMVTGTVGLGLFIIVLGQEQRP
jgi:hypothetical protein